MFKRIALVGNLTIALCLASTGAWAQDREWQVRKSSGDVWVVSSGAQQVALAPAAVLRPGDQVRTGKNGRTLLVRGDETILISPNSVIGLPKEPSEGLTTTIIQERGSILLEVEKRPEKHFEVETPYLVAVVKGTEFRVSVDGRESRVEVLSGQVEVAELKTGKFALVSPGQVARIASNSGLSLSGSGALDSIKQGTPRAPRVNPSVLPRDVRANGNAAQALRIKSALGEVKLDFQKVTQGIARSSTAALSNNGRANGRTGNDAGDDNRGNQGVGNGSENGLGNGNANGLGNGGGNGLGNGNGNGNGLGNSGGNGGGNAFGNGGGTAAAGLGNGLGWALGNGGCNGKGKGKGSAC